MITNFELFIEARIEDMGIFKGGEFKKYINRQFVNDESLLTNIDIEIHNLNKNLLIKWYDNDLHIFIERIKDRTSFKTTSEFNDFFKNIIQKLFKEKFHILERKTRYKTRTTNFCIYSKEYGFYIPISFIYDKLADDNGYFLIKTISLTTCKKGFYINI